jgi:hypothetical protein
MGAIPYLSLALVIPTPSLVEWNNVILVLNMHATSIESTMDEILPLLYSKAARQLPGDIALGATRTSVVRGVRSPRNANCSWIVC